MTATPTPTPNPDAGSLDNIAGALADVLAVHSLLTLRLAALVQALGLDAAKVGALAQQKLEAAIGLDAAKALAPHGVRAEPAAPQEPDVAAPPDASADDPYAAIRVEFGSIDAAWPSGARAPVERGDARYTFLVTLTQDGKQQLVMVERAGQEPLVVFWLQTTGKHSEQLPVACLADVLRLIVERQRAGRDTYQLLHYHPALRAPIRAALQQA